MSAAKESNDAHEILSVMQVAERCGVSVKSVRRAINRGDLAARRAFGRVLVPEEDLERYLEAGRIGGPEIKRRRRTPSQRRPDRPGGLMEIERAREAEARRRQGQDDGRP